MGLNTRPLEIHATLTAIGVPVQEVLADDAVVCKEPGHEKKINLVIAALGKSTDSKEAKQLKAFLGADSPEWSALIDVRNWPAREQRITAISGELTLALFEMLASGLVEESQAGNGYYTLHVKKVDWDAWREKLAAIMRQYPYEGE